MEKSARAAVVEARYRWSDIGSWDAVFDVGARDGDGNTVHGQVVTMDAAGSAHPVAVGHSVRCRSPRSGSL